MNSTGFPVFAVPFGRSVWVVVFSVIILCLVVAIIVLATRRMKKMKFALRGGKVVKVPDESDKSAEQKPVDNVDKVPSYKDSHSSVIDARRQPPEFEQTARGDSVDDDEFPEEFTDSESLQVTPREERQSVLASSSAPPIDGSSVRDASPLRGRGRPRVQLREPVDSAQRQQSSGEPDVVTIVVTMLGGAQIPLKVGVDEAQAVVDKLVTSLMNGTAFIVGQVAINARNVLYFDVRQE